MRKVTLFAQTIRWPDKCAVCRGKVNSLLRLELAFGNDDFAEDFAKANPGSDREWETYDS